MDKISKIMKSSLKNKVKITQSLLVAFLIRGNTLFANQPALENNVININIITNEEKKGLELGTKGYARGESSITTGTNNIAIGTNAVATGGNETKDTVEAKIRENKNRLDEITRQEERVRNESKELGNLRLRYRETIEAGNRVNALKLSQKNAYAEYERLKNTRLQLERDSAEKLNEHTAKLTEFNGKLKAVETIGAVDLSNDQDLEEKATAFKNKVEENNNLRLDVSFYKDYIKSHYKALGDLRKNEIIKNNQTYAYAHLNHNMYSSSYYLGKEVSKITTDKGYGVVYAPSYGYTWGYNTNYTDYKIYNYDASYVNGSKEEFLKLGLSENDIPTDKFSVPSVNITTDAMSDVDIQKNLENLEKFSKLFEARINGLPNELYSDKEKVAILNKFEHEKNVKKLSYEIVNLQWQYEQSGNTDTTKLNQKEKKLKEFDELKKTFNNLSSSSERIDGTSISYYLSTNIPDKLKKYFVEEDGKYYWTSSYRQKKIAEWNKANITDIKERNKITTDKLTSELERELGINKEAILEIERNIQNAKDSESRALNNYNNITISERDLLLAKEFEEVSRKILAKEQILLTATERLETLKRELTLNDFKDGENAIAFGSNTLASGTNSIAFGKGNIVTAESGIAIGNTNLTTGESSIAIGHGNNSIGTNSIALGKENSVKGDKSITIGYKNKVDGIGSSVIGDPNIVYGDNVHILGNNNKVGAENNKKNNVFILGSNIDATNIDNAIVLGDSSTAVANALSIGNSTTLRKIVNVKEATISNTSNEVVTGKQLYEVVKGTSTDIDTDKWKEILGVGTIDENSISGKLNTTMDNLGEIDNAATTKLITKLSEGANISTPANKLVTDTMVKTALDTKLDKTDTSTFIKIDGSNIDTTVKETLVTKLNNGVNFTNPTGKSLVTDSDVKNYVEGLGYITNADITNKVDRTELSNYYTKNESDSTFVKKENNIDKTNLDEEVGKAGYIKADALNNKLDSSEFTRDKITEKVAKGNINSTDLTVTGDGKVIGADITLSINDGVITKEKLANTLKTEIENKANSSDVYTKTETYNKDEVNNLLVSKVGTADLINKANTDASNISVEKFTEKLSEEADISNPKNKLTTDTKIKEYLDNNYYNNTEIDKKISNVKVKTEADIVSTTLDIENGKNRIIGTENISIEVKSNSISKDKLDNTLRNEIDNKANINGNNIVKTKDKEDFRNAIEVYSKNEIETKLRDVTAGTVNLDGEISETEERGVKGKVIDKHLKENYVHKNDLAELGNTINELEGRVKETVALSSALASIEYPKVGVGEVGIGAGISGYQGKQGVAIGAAYMPVEDLLLSLKYSGLTNNRYRGVVSASVGYKFRLHN